jgi:membrane fusion protein (multidrug efflux system)
LGVATILLFTIKGCWTAWEGGGAEQRTDDAYVRADMTPLSTRVSGTVRKVEVEDFATVKPGQLLVQLDDEDYQAVLAEARAALAGAQAELEDNQSAKKIQDSKIQNAETMVTQATAAVNATQAGISAVQSDVERTGLERKRQEALLSSKATTHQQFEMAIADADRFTGMLASHQAELERAKAALASSRSLLESEKRQRAALDTRDNLYRADIQAKQAAIIVAQVNLGYTQIVAPAAGAVGERHVQEGQLVAPGMQVVDLVKGDVWIQANLKETQLTNIGRETSPISRWMHFPGSCSTERSLRLPPQAGRNFPFCLPTMPPATTRR